MHFDFSGHAMEVFQIPDGTGLRVGVGNTKTHQDKYVGVHVIIPKRKQKGVRSDEECGNLEYGSKTNLRSSMQL